SGRDHVHRAARPFAHTPPRPPRRTLCPYTTLFRSQNVLCRFRWHTSAPMSAGRTRPTWAFMFAPSMYTCPPCACTTSQIARIDEIEEHTSELQSRFDLVCRLLLEKKKEVACDLFAK